MQSGKLLWPVAFRYCGSNGGKARENELTTEECLRVADELKELGCERVSLIGGEIFMRPDWQQIVQKLTSLGIRVCIVTNGFLFNDEIIQKIKDSDVESVAVSLDSIEEIHDRYRQPGSYKRAVRAIGLLSSNGITVSVITTLNHDSAENLITFWDYVKNLPVSAWQIQACSPMGNAAREEIDYRFDFSKVIDFISSHKDIAPFSMGIADNIGYFTQNESTLRGGAGSCFPGCSAGLSNIGIDSVGNIKGCESLYDESFIEGNIRTRSLSDIWNDENAFSYNRKFSPDMLTGKCASCQMGPYCAGGCRSYNHFVHGKLYESPFCAR